MHNVIATEEDIFSDRVHLSVLIPARRGTDKSVTKFHKTKIKVKQQMNVRAFPSFPYTNILKICVISK